MTRKVVERAPAPGVMPGCAFDTALLIGHDFEPGADAREPILNPRTGELILEIAEAAPAQIDRAVAAARRAFPA